MAEELAEHEGVVRFLVVSRETDVFIHVERDDMLEASGPYATATKLAPKVGQRLHDSGVRCA